VNSIVVTTIVLVSFIVLGWAAWTLARTGMLDVRMGQPDVGERRSLGRDELTNEGVGQSSLTDGGPHIPTPASISFRPGALLVE
jgi:hypothetical protein